MNESYIEIMVKKKTSPLMKGAQIVTALLAGFFAIFSVLGLVYGLILAAALGVGCYFLTLYSNVEYEYLYVDKELQIDRILGKSSRKRMETLDLTQLEILAPLRSHQLDSYRNGNYKKKDYSSGEVDHQDSRYMLIVNGSQIIFEPTEEMVKTIQMLAPRKVFTY